MSELRSTLIGRCNCRTSTSSPPVRSGRRGPVTARHAGVNPGTLAATQIGKSGLLVSGGEALRWYSASLNARRGFCRHCGAHLFWEPKGSDRISIFMGCLSTPTGVRLADHIFVSEKGDYYDITDGLPQRSD